MTIDRSCPPETPSGTLPGPETGLTARIRALIRETGPIDIAAFMAMCLSDPHQGYYATRDPFGAGGDFTTAPEISQMFGELIGVWLLARWRQDACPKAVKLVEFGPGRGTLMADILRAAGQDRAFAAEIEVHLVETSPHLTKVQARTLGGSGFSPSWHDRFGTVPPGYCLVVANEFFDAIPFRQFVRVRDGWAERVVGCGDAGDLVWGLTPCSIDPADHGVALGAPRTGQIVEISPMRQAIAGDIGRRIAGGGGAGLVIDYGHATSAYGDTFQAVRDHKPVDVLAHPGEADLTSHVDFAALSAAFEGCGLVCPPLKTQSEFLLDMGLLERAGRLGRHADEATRRTIREAVERLAAPEQMGHLFKVLCFAGNGPVPYPFVHRSTS